MTLRTIIYALRSLALQTPNVGSVIINDVYRENAWDNISYGTVAILQREHTLAENCAVYRFQLAYIDRLTEDRGNEVDVQSEGIMSISNIVNAFTTAAAERGVTIEGDIVFNSFNERFKDVCAGVIADVAFVVEAPLGLCSEVEGRDGFTYDLSIIF